MVWTSFIPIWWDCWLLELELNKNHLPHSRYGSKLCTPKHQVQCMQITNTPRRKRESLLCEVVRQPLREKDWARWRRTDGSEKQRRQREQSATVPATERQARNESVRVRESSTSHERERLRVRGRDWEWEGMRQCNVWSLNLVFLCVWFFCVPEVLFWVVPAMVDTYPTRMVVSFKTNRVQWTRFARIETEFIELVF